MKSRIYYNDLMEEWFRINKSGFAKSTYVKYMRIYKKYVKLFFENINVRKIDMPMLDEYRTYLENKLISSKIEVCGQTAKCAVMLVNRCLEFAAKKGFINTAFRLEWKIRSQRSDIQIFSDEEQRKIENHCMQNRDVYSFGIILCLYTGLRIGELCALRWTDIDIAERVLNVQRSVQRLKFENESATVLTVSHPKSVSSARMIPLPECIISIIDKFRCKDKEDTYVFSGKKDTPAEPRTFQYRYKRYLSDAGVNYRKFHTLRHSFATRCIGCGMDLKTLSEILGHSSVKVTLEFYCHTTMEQKRKQMNRLSFLSQN